ncbi:MAG: hypothetical protein ACRYHB_11335 [Janthinobacterium lividum]
MRSASTAGVPTSLLSVSAAPNLGYAWSQADRTLRPILGIPGAAQLGQSVVPAAAYDLAATDAAGRYAILLGENQSVYSMALPGGAPVLLAMKAADRSRIVFAPLGTFALVFAPGSSSATVIANLSGNLQLRSTTFAGPMLDAAVNDSGNVAAAFTSANGVSIQVSPVTGQSVSVAAGMRGIGGMAFLAGTDDLLLGDAPGNRLLRVQSASTSPGVTTVPTGGLLKTPASIGTSRTARWAVVANGAEQSAVRIDLTGGTAAQLSTCTCQPALVAQLNGDGAFRLTALQDGPLWIADASRAGFPVQFVPGIPSLVTAGGK